MEIPRLDRRTVLQDAGPQARLPVEAPDIGMTGLADGLATAAQEAGKLQAQRARTDLMGLESALIDTETRTIIGMREKRGRDALGIAESTAAEFDKAAQEIGKDIADPRVKQGFEAIRVQRRSSILRGASAHEFEQTNIYQDEVANAQLEKFNNLAATDPTQVDYAIDRSRWTIEDTGKRKGTAKEEVDLGVFKAESGIRRSVVKGMLADGRYAQASEYFEVNRERFSADDASELEGAVREGNVRQESQAQADKITAAHGSFDASMAAATAIEDADVRKETESRVRQFYSDQEASRNIREKQSADASWDIYEKSGDWRKIPPDVWLATPGPTREAIKAKQEGGRTGTDLGFYYEARQVALDDPETFVGMDLRNMLPALGPTEFKELTGLQEAIRSGKTDSDLLGGVRTETQIVDAALLGMGVKWGASANKESNKKAESFRRKVSESVRAIEAVTKKRATPQDVESLVDRLSMDAAIPYMGWFGPTTNKKPLHEVTPADITPEVRRDIERALKAEGMPVTEGTVFQIFLQGLESEAAGAR